MAKHNEIGKIGEDLATEWLISNGFQVIERNYRKKWGEIDIVALDSDRVASLSNGQARGTLGIHFIEVKSVSYGTKAQLRYAVSHETWRPEENVHREKIRRMKNAIQTWILEKKFKGRFQIDILTVRIVEKDKFAQINVLDNVIFE